MPTILFADDCANIRECLRQELEEDGYRVIVARDGKEALKIVESVPIDLAILDLWMPRVGGFEAAVRIDHAAPGLPIIFFTNNDELCAQDPRSALAVACVDKGGDLEELKRVIATVLAPKNGGRPYRLGLPPPGRRDAEGPRNRMTDSARR